MSWNCHSLAFSTPMVIQIEMQIGRVLKAQSVLWKHATISSREFYVTLFIILFP